MAVNIQTTCTGQKVKLAPREVVYEPPLVNLPAAFAGLGPAGLLVIATVLANWSAPVADASLARHLAEPPAEGEKRWDPGCYPRPATPADDPMRWQSW